MNDKLLKDRIRSKVEEYCESEYLRLIVLIEPPELESFQKLEPVERYIECLRRRTERACMMAQLRILPEMLSWVEGV